MERPLNVRPQLASVRAHYGYPYHQWMTQEFDELGWKLVQKSLLQKRFHDVTLLIEGPDQRFALMSKHSYPPGVFRSPSGGVEPGEDLAAGALREAREETGLKIDLRRFIHQITLDIVYEDDIARWDSYIFYATTKDTELNPTDKKEVREAQWATRSQVEGMVARLRATGNGGLIYRGNLTEASLWALDNPIRIREAKVQDMPSIARSLTANLLDTSKMEETLWWVAEVNGLWAGTLGITALSDCVELTGLTVEPAYQTRGLGHALVEYACDQWNHPEQRRKFGTIHKVFLNDKLWLLTPNPAYFLPVNFVLTSKEFLPESLKHRLTGPRVRWSPMRYQLYKL
jgi:ADP-ribose pyrophosphatase YjhB (NUDIX family)/N-acetylglutamate synthase-like GNAT family acetyltransferase